MPPQLFIFDLDGTLLDTRRDLALATNRMRTKHGLPPLSLETVVTYIGDGVRMLALRALEGAPADPDLAAADIVAAYAAHLVVHTAPYPGVDTGLRALRAAGHALAVATNKPAPHMRRLLDHFGWADLFAVQLGGGDTPELKPSPQPLEQAMRATGHTPATSWMVGDHHTDLEAARRAGIPSIFLEYGYGNLGNEAPTRVFSDFSAFITDFLAPKPRKT
ncbi:MAG: HAD-IA family hydrolase [Lentisphaerae bacterium]|jgi:phosphoglycolate phosphatase|nr:HAD-IA family hydrolase [Lentisphaerota bacterium]